MKRKNISLVFFIALTFISIVAFSQSKSNFRSIPEIVKNGDTIKVVYDANNTPLKNQKIVSAVMYAYQHYQWYASDISLKKTGNEWNVSVIVPKDCGLLAFKFKADTLIDNNHDQGYFLMMRDQKRAGLMAKGAYAGWGLSRSPKYGMDIPDYIKFEGISDSATYHWLNQEITYNQDAKSILVYPYAAAIAAAFKTDARPRLQRVLAYLKRADATESDLLNARKIDLRLLQDKAAADSIEQVLMQKFPKGSLARLAAFKAIPSGSDLNVIVMGYKKFITYFPEEGTDKSFNEDNRINYAVIKQNIIVLSSFLDKNYIELDRYLNSLTFSMVNFLYYKIVDIPLKKKEVDSKVLLKVSDKLIKRLEYLRTNQPQEYSYLSPKEWVEMINTSLAKQLVTDHMQLLNHVGRYKEALSYGEKAQPILGYQNAGFNNEFSVSLSKLGYKERLKTLLTKSVYENQASADMLALLKAAYFKEKGSDKGFEAYLTSLSNKTGSQQMKDEILKEQLNIPMVDFAMQDLNGKTVKLSDLKGKTVVFDFWATWCVPCKASFPGMKLAVEKYAKDSDVVFYFIDTEERGDAYKKEVAEYIKANNYPFNVLFDNKIANAKATGEVFNRVCQTFKISGIPQKIVVDKNGNARFRSVGFKGSATQLADEISTMVNITKEIK
ncbi:AhpC/TSA family protein [Pedobacter psychrotolerans]|uniref:AhpC/TSA family protein n=1 Tax=Pedobacter psychrotolerans TaxID=1843235 RepID=A0A4R2HHW6_9SPHI|nr:TlpA disulfide reductase family protein [Pedobacter psychrotolerans]TCO28833.1 AhpC/TSA family protein [Pedobacter psychrotolerans]GGE52123.1 hypothetical protein GCM10011413_18050 [Pedobacter psychrotolerans]